MKHEKLNIQTDLDFLLKKGKINSEVEHERAIMFHRQLRLLVKEHPELTSKRTALQQLIKSYEKENWEYETISDELIAESDAAEAIIEKESMFFTKRKELIKDKLKELSLTQKDFGKILGHSSKSYISELINGACSFSMRDVVLIHALLKIGFDDLIPTTRLALEKDQVVATIHKINPDLKINEETLELVAV
ncbi:helix-turn-helix transcriptional regulator [Mucilaginibacter sp. L3T2-6]|uniref:helix-turn-helix domain-containing protein n=1 Tax=Mucilaginibacter sp. L3T2-6 TaxID=3062491 RepID=UPI0026753611|nr:helix-turn-helix transcriptional regulator [Mucilaginibacter sp. L3T2-6]MDO3641770.1 helix-turn-helix transcriptional regulator [Mucilaginibacter sp. L3T2-6]MDV6214264.1 helix-turn-helix transcriptional regulator [Mucilaginibacter sp. L3T2-6]